MTEEIISIISGVASIFLGVVVYLRNKRSATNILLSSFSFANALLTLVNYLALHQIAATGNLFWTRIDMGIAVIHSALLFLLMYNFPNAHFRMKKRNLFLFISLIFITFLLAISPLVFVATDMNKFGQNVPIPGIGIAWFGLVVFGMNTLGIIKLFRYRLKSQGIERVQYNYIISGVIVTLSLIILINFSNFLLRSDTSLNIYLPLFLLPFVAATAYAIIRHRLFDIRGAILRSLSYTFLIGAVLGIYGLLLVFAVPTLAKLTDLQAEVVAAGAALLSIPVARFVQQLLLRLTDRFLFQQKTDYRKALVQTGDDLASTIQIEDVTRTVLQAMKSLIRASKTVILLRDPATNNFIVRAEDGARNFQVVIPENHTLLEHLKHAKGPLVKDEVILLQEQQDPLHQHEMTAISHAFTWLDTAVVLPLFVNNELTGLVLLGDKLSGEPYLTEDINFLSAFAPQAATALENARLYKESLQFGQKLQAEVTLATRELETANQQLKDLDRAKSEFLNIASHQLYTPLTALRGYLSMLQEGDFGSLSPKQQPIIEILEKSTNRLIELIKGLLDISRIESGRLELNLKSLDLAEMAQTLVEDLLPNARNKSLQLIFNKPTHTLAPVVGDAERLRQVMLNFVDNAIKYTAQGRVDVYITQAGEVIIFSVKDTGKGLSANEITKLFNKFTRVGGASRYHTEGSGLGLYVARQITREHNGDVIAESPGLGQGSTFSLRLPIEGSPRSLKVGQKASVVIKAAEA
jgi:signal transduction histidine kinase